MVAPSSQTHPEKVLTLQEHDRPQERLERLGASSLRDAELLAILLRSGTPGSPVLAMAEKLLADAGSLSALQRWSSTDFRRIRGIGKVKALQLLSLMELNRRLQAEGMGQTPLLNDPAEVHKLMSSIAQGLDVEKLWLLCLNTRNRLIRRSEISSGTATASLVHPREVFREALRFGATSVIVVHNHPSGDPQPSSADIQVTRQLRESARILGIDFADHVIVGRRETDPAGRGWYSFRSAGLL